MKIECTVEELKELTNSKVGVEVEVKEKVDFPVAKTVYTGGVAIKKD